MLTIPTQINDKEFSLLIILQDENVERIKQYDPAEIVLTKLGGKFRGLTLKDIVIMYATEGEIKQVTEMFRQGNAADALKLLSRGFAFRPDLGDNDDPYKSLIRNAGKS